MRISSFFSVQMDLHLHNVYHCRLDPADLALVALGGTQRNALILNLQPSGLDTLRFYPSLVLLYKEEGLSRDSLETLKDLFQGIGPITLVYWVRDRPPHLVKGPLLHFVERLRRRYISIATLGKQRPVALKPRSTEIRPHPGPRLRG